MRKSSAFVVVCLLAASCAAPAYEKARPNPAAEGPGASIQGTKPDTAQNAATPSRSTWKSYVGQALYDLEVADVNGDGLKDLLVMSHGDNALFVLRNTGTRSFTVVQKIEDVGFHPNGVRALDNNGDGLADELVAACEGISEVQWYRRTDQGLFALSEKLKTPYPPFSVAIGDVDGDGKAEAVLGGGPHPSDRVVIVYGRGAQSRTQVLQTGYHTTLHPKLGDVNGDGKLDIVVMNSRQSILSVFLNQGGGKFTPQHLKTAEGIAREVTLADVNRDKRLDYLLAFEVGKRGVILYNDGTGQVARQEQFDAPVFGYRAVGAYVNETYGLIALAEEGRIFLALRKQGDSTWLMKEVAAESLPKHFCFQDLDNDGSIDLAFVNSASGTVQVEFGVLRLFEK
jgi:hypothetical protein